PPSVISTLSLHDALPIYARRAMRNKSRGGGRIGSGERVFNNWVEKSRADLSLLITELPSGPYPYAGIPWFSTTFGRDGIITALQDRKSTRLNSSHVKISY